MHYPQPQLYSMPQQMWLASDSNPDWPEIDLQEYCKRHRSSLENKKLHNPSILNRTLHHDLGRMVYALHQVQNFNVNQALDQFFGPDFGKLPTFFREKTNHKLNHMGLEIYVPLDLWLSMLDVWQSKLSLSTGSTIEVVRTARFPSSKALQTRVGAPVEICCVWFQLARQKLMIELFDIGRPVPAHLRTNGLHDEVCPGHNQADEWIIDSFRDDLIWHYAIDVENTDRVNEIHDTFITLTAAHSQYRLAYFQPVTNRHDGSHHTKIIHEALGMELEFATHETILG
jgi:hypothetical protein